MTSRPKQDSAQPWQCCDGLSFAIAGELVQRTPDSLDAADRSPLANAIREAFPDSSPAYWNMIARRYRELFRSLPEEEAALAISMGFSSPIAAMRAGAIRKRKYVGFTVART